MNTKKITLDEFYSVKDKLMKLINSAEVQSQSEEDIAIILNNIYQLQEYLTSFDLSDIPFEAWSGLEFVSYEDHLIDFSKTRANIDFDLVSYYGNGRFHGCNVRGLKGNEFFLVEDSFDQETVRNNPDVFLSELFPKEFRERYYSKTLTLQDVLSLSDEEIKELENKDFTHHFVNNYGIVRLLDALDIRRTVDLYRLSPSDFEIVYFIISNGFSFSFSNNNYFKELLKGVPVSEIKKICVELYRNKIIEDRNFNINYNELPEQFFLENDDIFLSRANVEDGVRERIKNRCLTIDDLCTYYDLLGSVPRDKFLERHVLFERIENCYGMGVLQQLIAKYPLLFKYLVSNNVDYDIYKYIEKSENFDFQFREAVKKYVLERGIVNESNKDFLPDFLEEMGFRCIDKIRTMDDFRMMDDSTIVLDSNQGRFLSFFGMDNIKRFEEEFHIFNYKEYDYSSDLGVFNALVTIITDINNQYYFSYDIDNYDDFLSLMVILLEKLRTVGSISTAGNYFYRTDEFKKSHAELFLDDDAPKELRNCFYNSSLDVTMFAKNPEYGKFLMGKNIGLIFKSWPIKLNDDGNEKRVNFYQFISKMLDEEELIRFLEEYGYVLDILVSNRIDLLFSSDMSFDEVKQVLDDGVKRALIEKHIPYPSIIPKHLRENSSEMFLQDDAPLKLKEALYSREIDSSLILANPSYINYLKGIDLELIYKYMPIEIKESDDSLWKEKVSLIKMLKDSFGDDSLDIMLIYGKYLEKIYEIDELKNFVLIKGYTKTDILDTIDSVLLKGIVESGIVYDEKIAERFRLKNPTLFLGEDVSSEIKTKFYSKEFLIDDFTNNPNLLEVFGKTNVVCGFPSDVSWAIPLLEDCDDKRHANEVRLRLLDVYYKIEDAALKNTFKDYVVNNIHNISEDRIELISGVLLRLSMSNSSEISNFRTVLTTQILNSEDPLASLEKIEDMFVKNNIPTVGKVYSCFEILHPSFQGFDFSSSHISPVLKQQTTLSRKITVFSDLVRSSFGSNNRNVLAYVNNIEIGSMLFEKIKAGEVNYQELSDEEKRELELFARHLGTMYNNTLKAKNEKSGFVASDDVLGDLFMLSCLLSPNGGLDYNVGDRVIRMFCGFFGIDSVSDAKSYIMERVHSADTRNRSASFSKMELEKGDFIKGIGKIDYLRNILQNGSVSKEFLGASADSDATPLDTDVSMILISGTNEEKISATAAKSYGPIWFVLKNNDRFITTRNGNSDTNVKNDLSKLEVFYTGVLGADHYGIRTGFSSSDIDYIISNPLDRRVFLEVALNGFYIPVVDISGNIVFTPDMYDDLRKKMSGLSYYGENEYSFSENLITREVLALADEIDESNREVARKREKINSVIRKSLEELGLKLKTVIDGDLSDGYVELIDTGSTGRGTNKPGDGDFDFMVRLDKKILQDRERLELLKKTILKNFGDGEGYSLVETGDGDYRIKGVRLDDIVVDIDLTFCQKIDNISYSTDMALQDRLETIRKNDPEKYKYVVANILTAKSVLKEIGAYKPDRGDMPQGGLGGVGIENWILQNGGSFIDAARSFVEAAEGKSFEEFKNSYHIWDFGDNHLASRRGNYPHDDFVNCNMSVVGYERMKKFLTLYVRSLEGGAMSDTSIREVLDEYQSLGNNDDMKFYIKRRFGYKEDEDKQIEADVKMLLSAYGIDSELRIANMGQSGFMYEVEHDGKTYLVKPGINKKLSDKGTFRVRPARVEIQKAASEVQNIISPKTAVDVQAVGIGDVRIAIQEKIDTIHCFDIIGEHASELLGEYVVDYLIGNFDSDESNFIVDKDNHLRGIDKEQGLKYLLSDDISDTLRLDMDCNLGGTRGTLYKRLFERIKNGEVSVDLSYLEDAIEGLKMLDIEKIFSNYAISYDAKQKDEIISRIKMRREYFLEHINEFINSLMAEKNNIVNR